MWEIWAKLIVAKVFKKWPKSGQTATYKKLTTSRK